MMGVIITRWSSEVRPLRLISVSLDNFIRGFIVIDRFLKRSFLFYVDEKVCRGDDEKRDVTDRCNLLYEGSRTGYNNPILLNMQCKGDL